MANISLRALVVLLLLPPPIELSCKRTSESIRAEEWKSRFRNNNESVKAEEEGGIPSPDRCSDEPGVLHELINQVNSLSMVSSILLYYNSNWKSRNLKLVSLIWVIEKHVSPYHFSVLHEFKGLMVVCLCQLVIVFEEK